MKVSASVANRSMLPALVARLGAYAELAKPRLSSLVLVTTLVGFYIGSAGTLDLPLLFSALMGTALVAGGAAALNQWAERRSDALMERTQNRPLPTGRLLPEEVFCVGLGACAFGVATLALTTNLLTAGLALLTAGVYLLAYTPLKSKTPWCTVIGAIPGAIPPLIGNAAVNGSLDLGAWTLCAILFVWQLPHFYAIGWIYRDDYARAGCPMLPVLDRDGRRTARWIVVLSALLIGVSLTPALAGLTGTFYPAWALTLGLAFAGMGVWLACGRSRIQARAVFLASVTYLPSLLLVLMLDWTGSGP